ncbi:DUF6435 family protein [Vibrio ostreicida]|uniref:DUF6435 family protein n=1 Tax=Vibrio ostreicida TaxID=526588 RepID=A0ABT8BTY0_9VIBR|nr:DUF6435 family protein [Vibrio ostreicida]MDN3609831.1 DUF6435 family protein [Vibrio ostreicida]MDN3611171.1 DUF6435 family protein [Vibrio ostreicida]MDN3612781.1 DUF6435 family protein [Vibrio ostreicida]NPD09348.1 Lacal_2735 family protein [Vibrio ostreicida]
MLSFFKSNPSKKLRKQHSLKLEQAMLAQRKGDIRSYSQLTADADALYQLIQEIEEKERS